MTVVLDELGRKEKKIKAKLQAEKDDSTRKRLEKTLVQLHDRLNNNELGEVAQINTAIAGLNSEQAVLAKIIRGNFPRNRTYPLHSDY